MRELESTWHAFDPQSSTPLFKQKLKRKGLWAEYIVARELFRLGAHRVDHNMRLRFVQVDLLAVMPQSLWLVEVKYLRDWDYAEVAVQHKQLRKLIAIQERLHLQTKHSVELKWVLVDRAGRLEWISEFSG